MFCIRHEHQRSRMSCQIRPFLFFTVPDLLHLGEGVLQRQQSVVWYRPQLRNRFRESCCLQRLEAVNIEELQLPSSLSVPIPLATTVYPNWLSPNIQSQLPNDVSVCVANVGSSLVNQIHWESFI